MPKTFIHLLSGSLALALGGCSVYAPMQGAAPAISGPRQAELTVSSYLNSRFEASAAYSPLRYVLLRGAVGAGRSPGRSDTSYFTSRQYEAALGGYWPLNARCVAGVLLGYGQARATRGYQSRPVLFAPTELFRFSTRYNRPFAEVYCYDDDGLIRGGGAYRFNRLHFRELTNAGQPVPLRRLSRHELLGFFGMHARDTAPGPWRGVGLQLGLGVSFSELDPNRPGDPNEAAAQTRKTRWYATTTLQLYPHYWFARGR